MEHYQLTLTKARLAKQGSFRAELISDEIDTLEPEESVAAHRKVIRPLLAIAEECYVYGLRRGSPLLTRCEAILRPDRGRHSLDLSQEVVVGYEPLWNATGFERGSIVAVVPVGAFDKSLFRSALRFYVIDNPNVSHTPAAIRYCRTVAKSGKLAFSFTKHSARSVQVYGPPLALQQLYLSLPKGKRVN